MRTRQQGPLPVRTLPCGSLAAICWGTAPMPAAGRQLEPVARQRMTKSNRREVTRRLRSKKMPPRKGWKKRWIMASVKPSAWVGTLSVSTDRSGCRPPWLAEHAPQDGLEQALRQVSKKLCPCKTADLLSRQGRHLSKTPCRQQALRNREGS